MPKGEITMSLPKHDEMFSYEQLIKPLRDSADALFAAQREKIAGFLDEDSKEIYLRVNSIKEDIDIINAILIKKFK